MTLDKLHLGKRGAAPPALVKHHSRQNFPKLIKNRIAISLSRMRQIQQTHQQSNQNL